MVVLGVERWRCGLLGYKKRKRRRRKSCHWTGLIHRGEDSTKSGYKDGKCKKKLACVGKIPGQYQPIPTENTVQYDPGARATSPKSKIIPRFFRGYVLPPFGRHKAVILLLNTQINKYTNEPCRTVPSDGVFCVFVFFRWFYWRHGPHKCANTQMHK